ncbi:M20/M25/M40 family metallo-hydrolase [Campylobacter sp. US33a]|uniref:M20/M25/M40 family metallo-hydrolase n=1 Tax=Campylobacter sp. CCS1377 TaxID=3158229 RepID=A0AAU7EBD5_9BACT|nr:M20/M25/M40 family metallo-hydrolase [Campylobacter sp. US33a]MCW1360099.1 M20/M25/M40 family metallo-hydrolase [Campylobacter jejuni]TEY02403.1 M20/M25/M40 family metallo-hydrolase [Campylobacter sp. US33a]
MQNVLKNFKNLSAIPHCSFQTQHLKNFLKEYARDKKFMVDIDEAGNIHCIKGEPKICLQSHYDMVCMGEAPYIELYEEQGYLRAKNSSLGADNGIGVAIMMSAMANFDHLECLFTNDEEVGLLGANACKFEFRAKKLLNLDHESEKDIIIGCAGGVDIKAVLDLKFKEYEGNVYELEAFGFKGGHSGIDIIKNSKSSIKEMASFITKNQAELIEFNGGERINSIPKYAKALVYSTTKLEDNEWIKCKFLGKQKFKKCLQTQEILSSINAFSQGLRAYNEELKIAQTSINLSTIKMQENQVIIELFARSNVLEELKQIEFETLEFFKAFGYKCESFNFYPPWEGIKNEFSDEVHKALSKEVPDVKISAIHAGLECGILENGRDLLCCSIGPNIYNPHSTDERCEIKSVEKISKVVFEIIKNNQ